MSNEHDGHLFAVRWQAHRDTALDFFTQQIQSAGATLLCRTQFQRLDELDVYDWWGSESGVKYSAQFIDIRCNAARWQALQKGPSISFRTQTRIEHSENAT